LIGEVELTSARRPPLLHETYALVERLRRMYPVAVLDLPVVELRGTWSPLQGTTVPVLVSRASTEGLQHTLRLLAQLKVVAAELADRVVLVTVALNPQVPREVRAARHQAVGSAGAVVAVPFDPVLTRAEPVDVRQLGKATRRAFVDVAAAVLARCPADPEAAAALLGTRQQVGGGGVA